MVNTPANPKLYATVKAEAKQKFAVWPSAYASGWLVKTYKARGGTYTVGQDRNRNQSSAPPKKPDQKPLGRWYDEKWVDVCHYLETGKLRSCGRHSSSGSSERYPYCRPSKRISPETPETLQEIDRKVLTRRCQKKKGPDKVY